MIVEGSESLPHVWASIAYYGFMRAFRRHETPGSKIEDLITYSTTSNNNITYVSAPQIPRGRREGAQVDILHAGFAWKPKNPEFAESAFFMQTCFLYWVETRPLPSRLLPAGTSLSSGPGKEWSGLSILCRDTQGLGPLVDCHSQESPKALWYVILIIKLAAIYWASLYSRLTAHALNGLICILAKPSVLVWMFTDRQTQT